MSWNFFTNTGSLKTSMGTSATLPAGTIMGYAGATAPFGFLFCDATAVSRAGYPQLFSAIGTTFGAGDGSTTFNLPDLRGRTIVGLGTNAAVNALALSDGVAVASRRPQHRHTPHTHTLNISVSDAGANGDYVQGSNSTVARGSDTLRSSSASKDGGSGTATDSLDAPAFLVTNYIISTTTVAPIVASNVTAYGGSVASASSIAITGNSTYLLTGTTGVSTATGATAGNTLTLIASGQATGICVVLNNGTGANNLSLRDGAPSSADLTLAIGPGALISEGQAAGSVKIVDGKTDAQVSSEIKAAAATVCGVTAGDCVDTAVHSAANQYAAIKRAAQRDANPAKLDVAREDRATIRVKVTGRTPEQINSDIDLAANTVCRAVGAGDFRGCVTSASRSAKSQLHEITRAQEVASR